MFGLNRRDIQSNKESETKRSCWTHGESVQARLISPFGAKGHCHGPGPNKAHSILSIGTKLRDLRGVADVVLAEVAAPAD